MLPHLFLARLTLTVIISFLLLIPWTHGEENAPPGCDEITFELEFKDLNKADHTWPIGKFVSLDLVSSDDRVNPFIESLGIPAEHVLCFRHPALKGAEEIALEMRGTEPIALYIDLDASGSFTSNERLTSRKRQIDPKSVCEFKTKVFERFDETGSVGLYKIYFKVFISRTGNIKLYWKPFGFWTGDAKVGTKSFRFSLFDTDGDGSFRGYGKDRFKIHDSTVTLPRRWDLSSLFIWHDSFFRLSFSGKEKLEGNFCVTLSEDISPKGKWVLKIVGTGKIKAWGSSLLFRGYEDRTIALRIRGTQNNLPGGNYLIEEGKLWTDQGFDESTYLDLRLQENLMIIPGKTLEMVIGDPEIEIEVRRSEGHEESRSESNIFPIDSNLLIDHKIIGCSGEVYTRMDPPGMEPCFLPIFTIIDPQGVEVTNGFPRYDIDTEAFLSYPWLHSTSRIPGEYKIKITIETWDAWGTLEKSIKLRLE